MTLDYGAMQQLRAALDMAREDMAKAGKLSETDAVVALAEKYAAFLLCGEEAASVIATLARSRSAGP
jgi:hypothetical protein